MVISQSKFSALGSEFLELN